MATDRAQLKVIFSTGMRPNADEFAQFIDNSVSIADDKASLTDAEDASIDDKYLTPKTAKKTVERFAPVKKVNTKSPSAAGEVSLVIDDIPTLTATLSGKQATLQSGINIATINGASLLASPNIVVPTHPVLVKNSTPLAVSSTTRTTVANLNFNAAAGKKYKIEIVGSFKNDTLTAGGSMGFILSAGSGSISGVMELQNSTSGSEKKFISGIGTLASTANSFITSNQVSAIDAPGVITGTLFFECSAAGTFNVQWGVGGASSTATLISTSMLITEIV